MSPRRKVGPGFADALPKARLRWAVPAAAALAAVLIIGSVTVSALVLIAHERHRRTVVADVAVISYVRSFMTQYTSPDPFHANDYANGVLAQATGQLAQLYKDKMNEIVIHVAQAEPTKGDVLDAGIERWNDDGTASVVVATKTTTTMPDGKQIESGNRWLATATREGDQWKISNLLQVI